MLIKNTSNLLYNNTTICLLLLVLKYSVNGNTKALTASELDNARWTVNSRNADVTRVHVQDTPVNQNRGEYCY